MTRRPIAGERSRTRLAIPAPAPSPEIALVDEPVAEPQSGPPAVRRPRPAWVVVGAALAVLVVLAATAALLVQRVQHEEQVEQARRHAQAAAEQHAVTVLSYDHRHLDRDFRRAEAVLTGTFAEEYAATAEKVVRPTAEQVNAVVTASVAASSVVRAEESRVVVLLFVDQTTTSTRLDGPRTDLNRVRMTLTKVTREGRAQWLVSGLDAL